MARLAEVQNLIVVNIIEGEPLDFPEYIDVTGIECGIAWIDNGDGTFSIPGPVYKTEASAAEFGELLPDEVLVELYDIRNDTQETALRRQTAARILTQIASDVTFNPNGTEFETRLTQLVNNTSLTVGQATTIQDTLRNP